MNGLESLALLSYCVVLKIREAASVTDVAGAASVVWGYRIAPVRLAGLIYGRGGGYSSFQVQDWKVKTPGAVT